MRASRFSRFPRFLGPASAVVVLLLLAFTWSARALAPGAGFQVVCHPDNPATAIERRFLQDAFLKKITMWPTGELIRPVDLPPHSGVRRAFSEQMLTRPVQAVKNYWQQRIFSGREVPPPEVSGEKDVIAHTLLHRGALDYVSRDAPIAGLKVLMVR